MDNTMALAGAAALGAAVMGLGCAAGGGGGEKAAPGGGGGGGGGEKAAPAPPSAGKTAVGKFKVAGGKSVSLADVVKFVESLADVEDFTKAGPDVFIGRAPGRLDVMGGIADYSGSLVLQMPVAEGCMAAVRQTVDKGCKIYITSVGSGVYETTATKLEGYTFPQAKAELSGWSAYVAGCFVVLAQKCGFNFPAGAGCTVRIDSDVPINMGVSSSASVEVSTMQAVAGAFNVDICSYSHKDAAGNEYPRGVKIAILCQMVENHIVGAPCGIMDQMASNLGQQGKLLALLCRPAEVEGLVEIPDGMELWGINSGHEHHNAVTSGDGADYGSVRIGAFMGKKIWNTEAAAGAVTHLTELGPAALRAPSAPADYDDAKFEALSTKLPASMTGKAFKAKYTDHDDPITEIDESRDYPIATCTNHPIDEHLRVSTYRQLMQAMQESTVRRDETTLPLLGELMYGSHWSYSRCGIGSSSTDLLVKLAREQGAANGVFGAKITGGGSGGTVCVLTSPGGKPVVEAIVAEYLADPIHNGTCKGGHIFEGSSMGGEDFGFLQLKVK